MIGSIQYDVVYPLFVPEELNYHSTEEDNIAFDPQNSKYTNSEREDFPKRQGTLHLLFCAGLTHLT